MSEQMNRTEFENLMDEYLRGELNASDTQSFEQYLDRHPEVHEELAAIGHILRMTQEETPHSPPEDLIIKASAGIREELHSPPKTRIPWFKRPGFTWSLAASLLLIIGLTLWPAESSFVYARLIESLKTVESIQVKGWVRDETGARIPYRQWVLKDGSLRADLGPENHRRSVVVFDNKRFIKDYDNQLYLESAKGQTIPGLGRVMELLASTYENPAIAQASFKYSKEDLGQSVRYQRQDYASLGQAPSDMKWIMEVDKETALPTYLQLHQNIDGNWIQISHLDFVDFNDPPAAELFHLAGKATALNDEKKQDLWFELHISPVSIFQPALFVPEGGVQVQWLKKDDIPDGISSGISHLAAGGITIYEYRSINLRDVVKSLSKRNVEENEFSQIPVSIIITSKTNLPWEKKLAPILEPLGLGYRVSTRSSTRRRYIFEQNGSAMEPSGYRFSTYSVNADSTGYHYHFEKTPLKQVALTVLINSDHRQYFTENDTIEFFWNGDSEENPMENQVDLDCLVPGATFQKNVTLLKDKFGLEMRVENDKISKQVITLIRK